MSHNREGFFWADVGICPALGIALRTMGRFFYVITGYQLDGSRFRMLSGSMSVTQFIGVGHIARPPCIFYGVRISMLSDGFNWAVLPFIF